MRKRFEAFGNDAQSLSISELTIENGTSKVSIYGSLDVTRDKVGLRAARELKSVVDALVRALAQDERLPEEAPPPEPTKTVKNPFA